LFVTAVFAECNRLPFDLPECEQELVAGYHTEYSGMKFALFMIGEYTHMITTSFLVVIMFFGGWQILPFIGDVRGTGVGGVILKLGVLCGKMFLFICFYMMIRWTIPRFRFDQLMGLAWKVLLPLTLANLVAVMVVRQLDWTPWVLLPVSLLLLVGAAYMTLLMPKPAPSSRYVKGQLLVPGPEPGARWDGPRMTEEIAMPIEAKDVRWVEDPKMGVAELLYLPAIFAGLTVTFRHLFKRPMTQEFPEVRPQLPANYRGVHRL